MVETEEIEINVLEAEDDDVEDIASNWAPSNLPSYFITSSSGAGSGMAITHDGRIVINHGYKEWEPINKWIVSMVFGNEGQKVNWDEARKRLDAGQTYFGWLEATVQHGAERRVAWLTQGPLLVGKIK